MLMLFVKIGMSLSGLAFLYGISHRQKNLTHHRNAMALGYVLTILAAVVLVVGVYVIGATYSAPIWMVNLTGEDGAKMIHLIHRGISTLAFLFLTAQVIAGIIRHPIHKRLGPVAASFWGTSYVTGMIIFT